MFDLDPPLQQTLNCVIWGQVHVFVFWGGRPSDKTLPPLSRNRRFLRTTSISGIYVPQHVGKWNSLGVGGSNRRAEGMRLHEAGLDLPLSKYSIPYMYEVTCILTNNNRVIVNQFSVSFRIPVVHYLSSLPLLLVVIRLPSSSTAAHDL